MLYDTMFYNFQSIISNIVDLDFNADTNITE